MSEESSVGEKRAAEDQGAEETPSKRAKIDAGAEAAAAAVPSSDVVKDFVDSPSNNRRPTLSKKGSSKRDKVGRRERVSNSRNKEDRQVAPSSDSSNLANKEPRLPKRKVAVLVGYNGANYSGSQINPGMPTVEGELWQAFIKSGAVSEDNATSHIKVGLCRAARTDAGVNAAVNVICLKLITSPLSMEPGKTIEEHINSFLPPQVRVWSVIRVQGGFDPRKLCDQRHYQYTLPTSVFIGPKPSTSRGQAVAKSRESITDPASKPAVWAETDAFWSSRPEDSTPIQDDEAKKAYRISSEVLKAARDFVKAYEGSHNFYNFTVGKDFRDRACQRIMRSVQIKDPFIVNDVEYVAVHFIGQSFMLHQIRKMIGLLVLSVRTGTPSSLVPEAYGPLRIHVPKAPGSGLMLVEPQYDMHNRHLEESNVRLASLVKKGTISEADAADQTREPVRVPKNKIADVEQFKRDWVYSKLYESEAEKGSFVRFLSYFDSYAGQDFDYLNPKGVIPQSAAFKKGENAEQARKDDAQKSKDGIESILSDDDDVGTAALEDE